MTRKAAIGMIRAGALSTAFFLAGGALPFVGAVLVLFVPAPIVAYAVGRPSPLWRATASVALGGALVSLTAGPIAAIGFFTTFGLATFVICLMLEREQPFEMIVAAASLTILAAGTLGLLAATGSLQALVSIMHDGLADGLARSEQFYRALGVGSGIEPETKAYLIGLIVRLSPAIATVISAVIVMLNLLLFWRWFGKHRLSYALFGDLARWRTPEWFIWLLLATGFALFIPVAPLRTFALDSFICAAAVYFCQGMAIVAFYFRMIAMPVAIRGIVYCIALVQPVLAALVCVMGVLDMWVDFRRLEPPSPETGSFGDFL